MGRRHTRNVHLAVVRKECGIRLLCDPSRPATIAENWTHNEQSVTCEACARIIARNDNLNADEPAAIVPVCRCRECGRPLPKSKVLPHMVADPFEAALFGRRV